LKRKKKERKSTFNDVGAVSNKHNEPTRVPRWIVRSKQFEKIHIRPCEKIGKPAEKVLNKDKKKRRKIDDKF